MKLYTKRMTMNISDKFLCDTCQCAWLKTSDFKVGTSDEHCHGMEIISLNINLMCNVCNNRREIKLWFRKGSTYITYPRHIDIQFRVKFIDNITHLGDNINKIRPNISCLDFMSIQENIKDICTKPQEAGTTDYVQYYIPVADYFPTSCTSLKTGFSGSIIFIEFYDYKEYDTLMINEFGLLCKLNGEKVELV